MEYCGEIHVANVGIPEKLYRESGFEAETTGLWALKESWRLESLIPIKGALGICCPFAEAGDGGRRGDERPGCIPLRSGLD